MDETHLFHSVSNRKRSRNISLPRLSKLSSGFFFFLSSLRARDCMTFTLHDLADFYRERDSAPH